MPPPPARKEIVLALCAPHTAPVAHLKGRKRKFTKGGDGNSSQQGSSNLASGLRGKVFHVADRRDDQRVRFGGQSSCWGVDGDVEIGELERDFGKTASSLKRRRPGRPSLRRCVQRQIKSDVGSTSCGIEEAKDALRAEFQAHLAKISAFLGSLECIRSRDLALATVEGGMAGVRALQSETPPSLEAEDTRFSDCKGDSAAVDGDFDLVLADLKSACFLPTCSEDPEGKIPVVGENGGDAAPCLDEVMGEEEA
ncbi:hypothetical protein DY000_02040189 [Brassica cretica]|uniref:Uncharacterized protein n=1 Tax=Brassica cretica TaxID=69181 RepID=A0ABQ7BJ27_BRACR|nr:hypothetical protein DY000_02040189 [Brassica cretica]